MEYLTPWNKGRRGIVGNVGTKGITGGVVSHYIKRARGRVYNECTKDERK